MIIEALRNTVIYAFAAALWRSFLVLQAPLFSAVLLPDDFARLDILSVTIILLNLIVPLEIIQAAGVYYTIGKTTREKSEYFSTALWFTCLAYAIGLIVACTFSDSLEALLIDSQGNHGLIPLTFLAAAGQGLLLLGQNQLRWSLRARAYLWVCLITGLVTIVISLLLVRGYHYGVQGVIFGQLLGSLAGALLSFALCREDLRLHISKDKLQQMLRFSLPLVLSSLAVFTALFLDRFVIKTLLSLHDVGIYALAYRVAVLIGIIPVGASAALSPLIFHHAEQVDTPYHISMLLRLYCATSFFGVAVLGIFSGELVQLFGSAEYFAAKNVVPIIALSLVATNLSIFAPGLILKKMTVTIAGISSSVALINLGLCLALVQELGIIGAAWASLLSALIGFLLYLLGTQRYYPIPVEFKQMSLGGLLLGVLLFGAVLTDGIPSTFSVIILKLIVLGLSALIFYKLLVKREELTYFRSIVSGQPAV